MNLKAKCKLCQRISKRRFISTVRSTVYTNPSRKPKEFQNEVLLLQLGPGGGGGGGSEKNWVGVCGPFPKTLTLFMTKICDIPYPIYVLTKIRNPI